MAGRLTSPDPSLLARLESVVYLEQEKLFLFFSQAAGWLSDSYLDSAYFFRADVTLLIPSAATQCPLGQPQKRPATPAPSSWPSNCCLKVQGIAVETEDVDFPFLVFFDMVFLPILF